MFQLLVSHLESELGNGVNYAVCDQFGAINGRFHLHALLGGEGLEDYPRKQIEQWLRPRAGFSRVLPFEHGAAHYVGRYMGRNIQELNWDVRIGEQHMVNVRKPEVWGNVVATSADMPKHLFHQNLPGRHR